jgi:hypothetical protein
MNKFIRYFKYIIFTPNYFFPRMCRGLTIKPLDIPTPGLMEVTLRERHLWRDHITPENGVIVAYYPLSDFRSGRKLSRMRGNNILIFYSIIIALAILFTITSSFRSMIIFAFITGFFTGRKMALARMQF